MELVVTMSTDGGFEGIAQRGGKGGASALREGKGGVRVLCMNGREQGTSSMREGTVKGHKLLVRGNGNKVQVLCAREPEGGRVCQANGEDTCQDTLKQRQRNKRQNICELRYQNDRLGVVITS